MRVIFYLLSYFVPAIVSAQTILKGKIYDDTGVPVSFATITLSPKNNNSIITYSISDKNGLYHLSWFNMEDSVRISVSLLGYGKKEVVILARTATIDFKLEARALELKEVIIKSSPVWQKKDTINYNVLEFSQPKDRVIGDIIARLPGVEVTPGGQIKYNGKPINKFYIEGQDLLEDKYGIANNNIPFDLVERVQILENHQPIRALDSISFSDRAAINIKLKKEAQRKLIGRANLTLGVSPLLTEDELIGMLFKGRRQFINTYKFNNTGVDNLTELTSHNVDDYINAIQAGAVKSDLVSVVQPFPPPIPRNRYLFNSSHTASINQLVAINSQFQLRVNIDFVNDLQKLENSSFIRIYMPDDTISINEYNRFRSNLNLFQTDIALIANTPKFYFKNLIKIQGWWSTENSIANTGRAINQKLTNPFFNVSNDFNLLKTNGKYIREINSYVGYVSSPQNLNIMPGLYENLLNNNNSFDALIQEVFLKSFYTDNSLSLRKKKTKLGAQYKVGFSIQAQTLNSNLFINNGGIEHAIADTFQNNLSWQRYKFYNINSWSYRVNNISITVSLPLIYTKIDYKDTLIKSGSTKQSVFISPSAMFMLQITPKWGLSASVSYNQVFGDITGVAKGYILKNYRHFLRNELPLAELRLFNAYGSLTFKDPPKVIFLNLGIGFSRNRSNLLYTQVFNGNLERLVAILQENFKNSISFFGRLSKYSINWKTSMGLNFNYVSGNQQQVQNNKLMTFSNRNLNLGIYFSAKPFSRASVDYRGSYFKYSSRSQLQNRFNGIRFITQNFSFNYFPSDKIVFVSSVEHYLINDNFSSPLNCYFSDMTFRYKPKSSKVNYEIRCLNIFNTKSFSTATILNNIQTGSEYRLRPRQLLVRISFSF